MADNLQLEATIKNEMAEVLTLHAQTLEPADASWVQAPPAEIAGNTDAGFSATLAGGAGNLTGQLVYRPGNSPVELILTFTVNGTDNTAKATYNLMGPTVGAQITQGSSAVATYSYAR